MVDIVGSFGSKAASFAHNWYLKNPNRLCHNKARLAGEDKLKSLGFFMVM